MSNDIEQEAKKLRFLGLVGYGMMDVDFEKIAAYVLKEREIACLEARLIQIGRIITKEKSISEDTIEINEQLAKLTDLKGRKDDDN